MSADPIGICFVCMGNICRSPLAEAVYCHLTERRGIGERFIVDSAGTHAYHVGQPPDRRAQEVAKRRGVDLSGLVARQVTTADFARFDLLVAMDLANFRDLRALAPAGAHDRIRLALSFAAHLDVDEVPDPYYGAADGFERVFNLLEHVAIGLLDHFDAVRRSEPRQHA